MVVALEYTGYLVKLRQDVHPLSRLLGGLIQTRLHQELQSKWTPETTNSVTATPKNGELGRLTVVKRITRNRSNSEAHEPSPTRPSAGDPPPRGGAAITAWLCRTASGDPSRPPWGGTRRATEHAKPSSAGCGDTWTGTDGPHGKSLPRNRATSDGIEQRTISLAMPNPEAPRCPYTGAMGCKCDSE
jgi:hypothetical protein